MKKIFHADTLVCKCLLVTKYMQAVPREDLENYFDRCECRKEVCVK